MSSEKTSNVLRKKGRQSKPKTHTVIVGDGDVVVISFPLYRLPTIQVTGATTGTIILLPLK